MYVIGQCMCKQNIVQQRHCEWGKKAKEMAFQQLSYSKREHVCQCFCSGSGVSLCVGQLP